MRHIISILLENEAGALSRVSGLFSARGYNIESLTVAPTNDATVSRITVVTAGSDDVIEQIEKQLNKLVDVVQVIDLTADEHIEREMVLLKLHSTEISQSALDDLTGNYGGKVVDRSGDTVVVEISGTGEKLDRAIGSVPDEAIHELVRSGVLGIAAGRSNAALKPESA
ncbi:MAG: acetolactate synthase small subunit [Gammaproteobacteria bacterium]|nr:acetolactate synthase small subunit [Gammaproteobacteria bacterium]